jgi:two-component system OmpR family response regulator
MLDAEQIILVEDDDITRQNYVDYLEQEGYSVVAYKDSHNVIEQSNILDTSLILLDVELDNDRTAGFELCLEIRAITKTVPIAFLSSHHTEQDKIHGFGLGADDYLVKDSSLGFIGARVKSIICRHQVLIQEAKDITNEVKRGLLVLDNNSKIARWNGHSLSLSLTQYFILHELTSIPGEIKSPLELMKAIERVVEPNTIAAHIKAIRQTFLNIDPDFSLIVSEYGRGYRWVEYS